MVSVYDVPSQELIERTAKELQKVKEINPPDWAKFVKTGSSRERPPQRQDWWHVRAASILRTYYIHPELFGVEKLRTKYGGRKNRGARPEKFKKASGNIIRKCLQQLESAGFIEKSVHNKKKGRKITAKGKSFLDKISSQISKGK